MRNLITIVLLITLLSTIIVSAIPSSPDTFTILNNSRRSVDSSSNLIAWAGNITQLNIDGKSSTATWAGFYGNISGFVTLDDANNRTIYDWNLANPEGEIYATANRSINWSSGNIRCWNFTQIDDEEDVNLTEYENSLNINVSAVDGINETFKFSNIHDELFVGTIRIDANTCPATALYNASEQVNPNRFQEIMLYDDTNNAVIFTSILENDVFGFTNKTVDFELIVAEDGHSGDANPTTYYFYVELQ